MARLTPILLGLTFVIAVAALVLALWPVVADAPWDDAITEAELSEILRAEQEASKEEKEPSSEEKEAERVAKCQTADRLMYSSRTSDRALAEIVSTLMENRCFPSP